MSEDLEDAEDLGVIADRLEAALERIARRMDAPVAAAPQGDVPKGDAPVAPEILVRLDGLIARLRAALADMPERGTGD